MTHEIMAKIGPAGNGYGSLVALACSNPSTIPWGQKSFPFTPYHTAAQTPHITLAMPRSL